MYSFSGNCETSIPISTLMCLWAIYIFPGSVHIFSCSRIGRSILGIYKCSQTHECGNWDCGRAIPFLGNFFRIFGIVSLQCMSTGYTDKEIQFCKINGYALCSHAVNDDIWLPFFLLLILCFEQTVSFLSFASHTKVPTPTPRFMPHFPSSFFPSYLQILRRFRRQSEHTVFFSLNYFIGRSPG